jgi:3-oxoacyl-[acyl-carrier-protein] synthase-3
MQLRKVKILGTGKYLPQQLITSAELDQRLGVPSGWSEAASGVAVRHFITDETASLMGAFAAGKALERAGISLRDIDCLISASGVMEQAIPCTAALISAHLGGEAINIPAYDINSTCLSFLTALDTLSYLVAAGRYRHVLIVSSEVASVGLNWQNKETCVLFGDGAAAAVIGRTGPGESSSILTSRMETYSEGAHFCEICGGGTGLHPRYYSEATKEAFLFRMDGKALFKKSAQLMPDFMRRLLEPAHISLDEIKLVIPHQASGRAMELVRRKLGIESERFMTIIKNHGNTIAASIPMALHAAIEEGRICRGDRIMLLGTSAGLSLGGMVLVY